MSFQKLSVVVPVYNEEEGIRDFLRRVLQLPQVMRRETDLSSLEILVVDDGSTDGTGEILQEQEGILLLRHEKNRGYGAALQTGFRRASGDLVGFLDADSTCRPESFVTLYQMLLQERADLAIGSRLNSESRMPLLRKWGNRFYARVIWLLTGRRICDPASGMRLFQAKLLPELMLLPSGLNFTPAMTARVLSDPALKVVETPIPYEERLGSSKLRLVRDGILFLKAILEMIFSYSPLTLLGGWAGVQLLLALGYGMYPIGFYWRHHRLREDMIYRLLAIEALVISAAVLLCFGAVAQKASRRLLHGKKPPFLERIIDRLSALPWGITWVVSGVLLNLGPLAEYLTRGQIHAHWVYILMGGMLVLFGMVLIAYRIASGLLENAFRLTPKEGGAVQ